MAKQTINLLDNYSPMLKEKIHTENFTPKGVVGIYDKLPNGNLKLIERKNLIVYQGRNWLMQRAFGPELQGRSELSERYIKWFGVGTGGGEEGNPLQAGLTRAWDKDLIAPLAINAAGVLPNYTSRTIGGVESPGYFKSFSSVVRKDDPANMYEINGVTYYPALIAEIRIEIASEDANGTDGSGYADINEAGLFIDNPDAYEASSSSADTEYSIHSIQKMDASTMRYIFGAGQNLSQILVGDRINVTGAASAINNVTSALITDMCYESGPCLAYADIYNPNGVNQNTPTSAIAAFETTSGSLDISMFSRVTFSSLRKTVDREVVFLWKIYF